ncbi:MAG: DUF4349 domain-containing protein [Dehalococcoidia bacterium]|nr:DUF4349 domain-containing protein [Dehalococcoidia bacterium]
MKTLLMLALMLVPVLALACGGNDSPQEASVADGFTEEMEFLGARDDGMAFMDESMESTMAMSGAFEAEAKELVVEASAGQLQDAQRDVISTASMSIEVDLVPEAAASVRMIADANGGFIENLSTSGVGSRQSASITLRVPQDRFDTVVEQLSRLGDVPGQNISSEDVTEEFIDLKARLNASTREEQSLLDLLARADSVADVLGIERELSRVRSQIERLQGQINFLQSRIDLSTIYISLFSSASTGSPPSAMLEVETDDVGASTEEIKALVGRFAGELEQVVVTINSGEERAYIVLKLLRDDFRGALSAIEAMGEVVFKSLEEGTVLDEEGLKYLDDPDASVEVTLVEAGGLGDSVIIAITVGSVLFVGSMAGFLFLSYRLGRRRRSET